MDTILEHMNPAIKNVLDGTAIGLLLAVVSQAIPVIAGLLTIVWGYYRIKEMRLTVQIKEAQLRNMKET